LSGYSTKPADLPPQEVALQRFRIGYSQMVEEFIPKFATNLAHTQYAQQRPTWYSGAMAEVMQIVGGYGRQDFDRLPKTFPERARMNLPEAARAKIKVALSGVRLPGYTGLPPANGQFQYDYKFFNTNGVSFDAAGKPWLLSVRSNGVWAMPLPIVPATTTQAFREYVEKVGDEEILAILDRFGGMPSGEGFPTRYLQAWRRAGVVVKVCDVGDFTRTWPIRRPAGGPSTGRHRGIQHLLRLQPTGRRCLRAGLQDEDRAAAGEEWRLAAHAGHAGAVAR